MGKAVGNAGAEWESGFEVQSQLRKLMAGAQISVLGCQTGCCDDAVTNNFQLAPSPRGCAAAIYTPVKCDPWPEMPSTKELQEIHKSGINVSILLVVVTLFTCISCRLRQPIAVSHILERVGSGKQPEQMVQRHDVSTSVRAAQLR